MSLITLSLALLVTAVSLVAFILVQIEDRKLELKRELNEALRSYQVELARHDQLLKELGDIKIDIDWHK